MRQTSPQSTLVRHPGWVFLVSITGVLQLDTRVVVPHGNVGLPAILPIHGGFI